MPLENSLTEVRFLPGLDKSYNGEIRAFVLRNHLRLRRLRTGKPYRCRYRQEDETERTEKGRSFAQVPFGPDSADGRQLILPPVHSIIGQGRRDPFQTCAKVLTGFEEEMFDRWVQSAFTNYNVSRLSCFSPQRDLLASWVRHDETLLYAAICNSIWTLESGGIVLSQKQALRCRRALYAKINNRIDTEGKSPSWELLETVAAVICTLYETRNPVKSIDPVVREARMHIDGLRALIRAKGGWYTVTTSFKELSWLFLWADCVVNGELSIGSVLPPADPFLSFSPSQYGGFPIDLCMVLYAEELVHAYAAFRHMALVDRQTTSFSSDVAHFTSWKPFHLFRRGSHLYQLIESEVSRTVRPISALLLVHLILQACQSQSLMSQLECFKLLHSKLDAVDALHHGSIESMIWGLMTDMRTFRLSHRECLEILVRHLYVEYRLSAATQRRLRYTLLEFLHEEAADVVTSGGWELAWWTPEVFRCIVYRDLGFKLS